MFTRTVVVDGVSREGHIRPSKTRDDHPKLTPNIIQAVVCITLCLSMLVLGVMGAARIAMVPQILELQPEYLPGSPKPRDISCYLFSDEHDPRCSLTYLGHEMYFSFDPNDWTIIRTIIPAGAYTIGQLMVAWGSPSGMTWHEYSATIYWGARTATLYAHSIRPDSRVDLIVYEQEPPAGSPWRGFRRHKY